MVRPCGTGVRWAAGLLGLGLLLGAPVARAGPPPGGAEAGGRIERTDTSITTTVRGDGLSTIGTRNADGTGTTITRYDDGATQTTTHHSDHSSTSTFTDAYGSTTVVTHPDGTREHSARDAQGNPVDPPDADAFTTEPYHHGDGDQTTTTRYGGGARTRTTTHRDGSKTIETTHPDGTRTTREVGPDGQVRSTETRIHHVDGSTTTQIDRGDGSRTVGVSLPIGEDGSHVSGRRDTNPDGSSTRTTWIREADGATLETHSASDGTVKETRTDSQGETTSTTERRPDGTTVVTTPREDGGERSVEMRPDGTVVTRDWNQDGSWTEVERRPDGTKARAVNRRADGIRNETWYDGEEYETRWVQTDTDGRILDAQTYDSPHGEGAPAEGVRQGAAREGQTPAVLPGHRPSRVIDPGLQGRGAEGAGRPRVPNVPPGGGSYGGRRP